MDEAMRASDMSIVGQLFAFRFVDGCSNGCVELYVEDDDNYHLKATFDVAWLADLIDTAKRTKRVAKPIRRRA